MSLLRIEHQTPRPLRGGLRCAVVLALFTTVLGWDDAAYADPLVSPAGAASVSVHVSGTGARLVTLETHPLGASEDAWSRVCDAPCDARVPLDGTYRVAGPDLQPSGDFQLHETPGMAVNLDVTPVTTAHHETGKAVGIGGAVVFGVGLTLIAVYGLLGFAAGVKNFDCQTAGHTACTYSAPSAVAWTGIGMMTVGVAALAAGLAMAEDTSVRQAPPRSEPKEPAPEPDRWAPTPSWGAASPSASPLAQVPLLAGTF